MVNWPARGTTPWDTPLKAYLDGSFASKAATEAALGRVDPGANPAANQFIANIGSQRVWIKLPHVDPTASAYGMSSGGTAAANATALANAASAAVSAGLPLRLPVGEYPCNPVTLPSGLEMDGKGQDRTMLTRASGSGTMLTIAGSIGAGVSLSADAALGATSVQTATNPGLVRGDVVYLVSDRNPNAGGGTAYQPDQDVQRVLSVTGSGPYTVTFSGGLSHAFATANAARLHRMTPARVSIAGIGIRLPGNVPAFGLWAEYTDRLRIEDVQTQGFTDSGMWIVYSLEPTVDGFRAIEPGSTGNRYGLVLGRGTRFGDVRRVVGVNAERTVAITAGASYNTVADSTGIGGSAGFDTHGQEARGNRYVRCRVQGSSNNSPFVAGNTTYGADYGTEFDQCEIVAQLAAGSGLFRASAGAEDTLFRNCAGWGGVQTVYVVDAPRTRIEGGRFGGASGQPIRFQNSPYGSVRGAHIDSGSLTYAVQSSGTSDYLIVAENHITGTGTVTLVGTNNVTANNVMGAA